MSSLTLTAASPSPDPWTCDSSNPSCKSRVACLVIGIVLTALAAVATYYSLVNGLQRIDSASTTLLRFQAGALIYTGVTFSLVAVGNALYTGYKFVCQDEGNFEYTPTEAKVQIAFSIFAPIAAVPGIIILSLGAALK